MSGRTCGCRGTSTIRPALLLVGSVVCACAVSTHSAASDIVYLKSGDALEGTIRKETAEAVVLEINRGTVWINRSDIAMIRRDERPTQLSLDRLKLLAEEIERAGEAARGAEIAPAVVAEAAKTPPDAAVLAKARDALQRLASEDAAERGRALTDLRALGRAAVPAITGALSHQSTYVRTEAAALLGQYNAREAVRELIVAMRSAVPDGAKVRPWQRMFVRELNGALRRTAGQSFDVRERGVNQDKVVAELVAWWDGTKAPQAEGAGVVGACVTWDTPQVGEAPVAEDDPERQKKLYDARKIGGSRYSYSAPKSFTEGVLGD